MARPWWWSWVIFLLCLLFITHFPSTSRAQRLSSSQTKALFRLQRILEYPAALSGWNNHTDFCYLPPSPSLSVACSGNRVAELSVSGGNGTLLSPAFSIDSLFTTLSRLPNLTALSLVSLGIWGPLSPKVHRLRALRLLNLTANHMSGGIPGQISTMASLRSLALDGNRLDGRVPDLSSMPSLEEVYLAGNRLGGAIPPSVFSLPSLRHLDLSRNRLAGELPASLSCGARLGFVDISGNRLVGALPGCIRSNSSGLVVLDAGNCLSSGDPRYQRRSSYCNEGAIAAAIPVTPMGNQNMRQKRSRLGLIAGIAGGVVGGAVVLGMVLVVVMKKARRMEEGGAAGFPKPAARKASPLRASPKLAADTRHMTRAVRMGTLGLMPHRVFSMEELEEATDNFDPSNLRQGNPQHQMYKGWLQDGSTVVIRCLKLKQKYSSQCLAQFIDVISQLRHRHLVSVLGHCFDGDQENASSSNSIYLVFEHISNGTLRSHLTEWHKHEMLKWPQRVAAVIGVARGIQFLHSITFPGISGNDLKIENILLDEALTAKISNYNLHMVSTNKNNKGASESLFAETEETNLASVDNGEKEDVYQLGLLLLEVITGKPVATQGELGAMKTQMHERLTDEPGKLCELVDPSIRGTFSYDSLRTAVEIGLNCVSDDPSKRPSVDDIIWNLQYSVQVQDGWGSSGSLSGISSHM